ncbi:MAG: thioesterase family protein [Victivallaceae bacterium]
MSYHEMTYRVPYADTDQMGVVYYANYLVYFERSRTEMLRDAGMPYSELEKQNCFLPVAEANCKYFAPAHYDELLTFRSWLEEIKGVRVIIASEVLHDNEVLVRGWVTLACINASRKLIRPPQTLITACRRFSSAN